jgi:hypothetical protein
VSRLAGRGCGEYLAGRERHTESKEGSAQMFCLTYLRRELSKRNRQAMVIARGGGLVISVTAVSSGVNTAQAKVEHALYGVGTDVAVTEDPPPPSAAHLPPGVCLSGQTCPVSFATRLWER